MALLDASVSARDVERAEVELRDIVRETPMLPAGELGRRIGGARVWVKAENLQRTGSFKPRGAANKIASLSAAELRAGVVAASAGNHAQGLAYAAGRLGARATVCMPAGAPLAKRAATARYGAEVLLVEGSYDEAREAAAELARNEERTLVPAFDDPLVVAGQGTVGLEIARQAPGTKLLLVPLGGGGLATGVAIAVKDRLPGVRVVGVQAEACAPYPASLAEGRPIGARSANTICDGIAVKRPGELTLPLVERYLDDVVTVSDDQVAEAMVLLLERSKLVVEGAGAVGVAALMHGVVAAPQRGGEVCVVLSGGNVDASLLAECIRLGETAAGRRIVLSTVVPDRPGALAGLLRLVADEGANVVEISHLRDGIAIHLRETAVQLVLETTGPEHDARIVEAVRGEGFAPEAEALGAVARSPVQASVQGP